MTPVPFQQKALSLRSSASAPVSVRTAGKRCGCVLMLGGTVNSLLATAVADHVGFYKQLLNQEFRTATSTTPQSHHTQTHET
jgi:hypothetical protein